jgi:hypothetical protein
MEDLTKNDDEEVERRLEELKKEEESVKIKVKELGN